jgi:hypothetical protein
MGCRHWRPLGVDSCKRPPCAVRKTPVVSAEAAEHEGVPVVLHATRGESRKLKGGVAQRRQRVFCGFASAACRSVEPLTTRSAAQPRVRGPTPPPPPSPPRDGTRSIAMATPSKTDSRRIPVDDPPSGSGSLLSLLDRASFSGSRWLSSVTRATGEGAVAAVAVAVADLLSCLPGCC